MSTPAPRGSDSPVWTRRGDDPARSWGREKEPGAAFRGVTRGRGRGGGAVRGRPGPRGGGGRGLPARGTPDLKPTVPPFPEKVDASGQAANNGAAQSKGRGPPKSPIHPPLAVDLLVSQPSDSAPPLSPNKPRRRRNNHKRSASAALPKPIVTTLTNDFPSSPSTPLIPSAKDTKDPPPHIGNSIDSNVPVHDLRQDIYSLVEHTRSMAMDSNRPSSPSTHIDWAADDGDDLPDLYEWGVSSKLASEEGESAIAETKAISVTVTSPNPAPVPISEKVESVEQADAQPVAADGTQSSAESPTESSTPLSVPQPAKRERERRRERGSRRDKEKRASLALQMAGSKGTQVPSTATPKKSLLERLSSPVRPEPPALSQEPDLAPSPGVQQAIFESTSGSTLPRHPSLPPKPANVPTKPPLLTKALGSWREKRTEGSLLNENTPSTASVEPTTSKADNERSSDVIKREPIIPPTGLEKETDTTGSKSQFDWSEEPIPFDTPTDTPKGPSIDIEPATPFEISTSAAQALPSTISPAHIVPAGANAKLAAGANPRFRSQRPLSGDVTPRTPRDRSPYKTHNPRNHSAPHAGPMPSPTGRTRPQHASRPIIRMDALAMISRSLRGSTPPQRESPPTTKVLE